MCVLVYETSLLPLRLEELQQHWICVQPLRYRLGHLENKTRTIEHSRTAIMCLTLLSHIGNRSILTLRYRRPFTSATSHRRGPPENSSCGWKAWRRSRGHCGWSCHRRWRPRDGRDPGNSPWPWATRCCRSLGRPCVGGEKVGRRISRGAKSAPATGERARAKWTQLRARRTQRTKGRLTSGRQWCPRPWAHPEPCPERHRSPVSALLNWVSLPGTNKAPGQMLVRIQWMFRV